MSKINKKGVSLAELLAVVVIMGIIAAIAIPLVGNVIEDTRKNAVYGDATTLQSAANTYCTLNPDDCTKGSVLTEAQLQEYVSSDFSFIETAVTTGSAIGIAEPTGTNPDNVVVVVLGTNQFGVVITTDKYIYVGNPSIADADSVVDYTADADGYEVTEVAGGVNTIAIANAA